MAALVAQAWLFILSLFVASTSAATWSPILPPSFPLAVKNPYLSASWCGSQPHLVCASTRANYASAWLPGNQAADLPSAQPEFWHANALNWSIIARVDGTTYNLFGVPSPEEDTQSATVVNGSFTSTRSTFDLTAGDASISLEFFSPVSPNNLLRQSLPFSFLTVTASGRNGATPSVQVYSDIDDTWTGQSASSTFNQTASGATHVWQVRSNNQVTYSEVAEMAGWGEAVYAARADSFQSGPASTVRSQFVSSGALTNSTSDWSSGSVVGLAFDLGTVSSSASAVYAIGYVREDAINYRGTPYTGYYRAANPNTVGAASYFLDIYDDAIHEADSFDAKIRTVGDSSGGSNYTAILELSVRQIFGGIDITVDGNSLDTSAPYAFIKEISSNGNLNTIDIIFPSFPFLYEFAPNLIKLLLEPVLAYLETGAYPNPYMIHDLGTHYPNATGHDDGLDEAMPIEESGNLLILALAYQTATGDTTWASSHAALFQKYADYLVDNGLYPTNQLSTNDGLGAFTNMTNLGVKAAVGLTAYGKLTWQANYTSTGQEFAQAIWGGNETTSDGLGSEVDATTGQSYFTTTYSDSSWFLVFNVYPDVLFSLSTFPNATYSATSAFYPTVRGAAGVAIDGAVDWGKTDWQIWTAATVEADAQAMFVNDLYAFIANGKNTEPFGDRYWAAGESVGETAQGFRGRPTLGGHFAIAVLKLGVDVWEWAA
ncbi:glutaminase [Phyllosticta paracitricarpa]|uniref:Glutaminase n=2 Tax=Phyllosticta TaxID=121621 RepID=A0ABR1MFR9_9PEZI